MALETGDKIIDLVTVNPKGVDPKSQGDDHLRLIKTVLKKSFVGFPGAILVTGTEVQGSDVNEYTLTSGESIQAYSRGLIVVLILTHTNTASASLNVDGLGPIVIRSIDGRTHAAGELSAGSVLVVVFNGVDFTSWSGDDRVYRTGDTVTGAIDFVGPIPTALTAAAGDSTGKLATTAFVQDVSMSTALPLQLGNAGMHLATDGASASWVYVPPPLPDQLGHAGQYLRTDGAAASWASEPNWVYTQRLGASSADLVATDGGHLISLEGTMTTQAILSSDTTVGWYIYIRNHTTSPVAITSPGVLIRGVPSYELYTGEVVVITRTALGFEAINLISGRGGASYLKVDASTIWKVPNDGPYVIHAIGSGGSGGASTGVSDVSCSGGGGGGYAKRTLFLTRGQELVITLGAGGASRTTTTSGATGGDTTVVGPGVSISITGGSGGARVASGSTPVTLGGVATGGDVNRNGGNAGSCGTGSAPRATGGGAAGIFGTYSSGNVGSGIVGGGAASAGAGVGGNSDVVTAINDPMAGGGSGGAATGNTPGIASTVLLFGHTLAAGGIGLIAGFAPPNTGIGGGSGNAVNVAGGTGGTDAYGGTGALTNISVSTSARSSGNAGFGGGSGGCAASNAATQSGYGGDALVVIESTVF